MSLKHLLRSKQPELLVTPRLETYLARTPSLQVDHAVAQFIAKEVSQPGRDRSNTFSASARGKCLRAQVFAFTSLRPVPRLNSDLHAIFHDGTFRHLRWQATLLDAGILGDVEVGFSDSSYRLVGTLDGMGDDETGPFGWELKGANEYTYRFVLEHGPRRDHLLQIHAYMHISGLERFSLMYENKNDQTWKEFVITRDEEVMEEVMRELREGNQYVDKRELPPILEECKKKTGAFTTCEYAHACLQQDAWPTRVIRR